MNRKNKKTLSAIYTQPTLPSIVWKDIESLLIALGATITEGRGSRIRILLNNEEAVFHCPHPGKEADKGSVASMRRFLKNAGIDDEL